MERETVWVSSTTRGWVLDTVVSISGDTLVVQTSDGESIKTQKKDVLPFQEHHKSDVEDMIALPEAHEALILYNLENRFKKDKIYTYIGPVIISINPFKDIKNTGESIINQYLSTPVDQLPPHLYAIAHNAYHSLVTRGESQSVVISGESGAGKTEATKVILKFLTVACGQTSSGPRHTQELSDRILATNPVLEAFGNAKTVRNNNSSRFGKFISIVFNLDGSLNSASISNYLLETVRVVTQAPTERNYHVFYQLLVGSNAQERTAYKLKENISHYRYLTHGNITAPGIDDKDCFIKLKQSMTTLGILEKEQANIFLLLSGILNLGNVEFEGQDKVKIKNSEQLELVCNLLQVEEQIMNTALTLRLFSGGNRQTAYNIPLDYTQAIENRDALAKSLYSHLFDYLVQRINKPLLGDNPPIDHLNANDRKFIGVLDIYGFEVFKMNSMEQFCINYANEKLHQQFNQHMFKAEQALYTKEGVPWETIKFVDNQDCIDLIEGFGGVLAMLDEEGKVPKGSDKGLLEKMTRKHGRHPRYKFNPKAPTKFGMDHYAGLVEYDVDGFLLKNKDNVNRDLVQAICSGGSQFIQDLFAEESNETAGGSATDKRGGARSKATVCGRFHQSLTSLVGVLSSTMRHYVRCIKPNDTLLPGDYASLKVLTQLRSNGIFETIRMRKAGYASHLVFDTFYQRFGFLGIRDSSKENIGAFLRNFLTDMSQWTLGNTKVFLREKSVERLETLRREIYIKTISQLQSFIRTYLVKQKIEVLLKEQRERNARAVITLQRYIRRWNGKQMYQALWEQAWRSKCIITTQQHIRSYNAKIVLINLVLEKKEIIRKQREELERQSRVRAEADRKAREEAERKAREEAERKARDEAERKAREEAEKRAREEAERRAREESERRAWEDTERQSREEAERRSREEAEQRSREEAERRSREDAEQRSRQEAEWKSREEKVREEEERQKKNRYSLHREEKNQKICDIVVTEHPSPRRSLPEEQSPTNSNDDKLPTTPQPARTLSTNQRTPTSPQSGLVSERPLLSRGSTRTRQQREEFRRCEISIIVLQKYIRAWKAKRYAIGLILNRIEELRELLSEQEQEREEWRQRKLQMARSKSKNDKLGLELRNQKITEEQEDSVSYSTSRTNQDDLSDTLQMNGSKTARGTNDRPNLFNSSYVRGKKLQRKQSVTGTEIAEYFSGISENQDEKQSCQDIPTINLSFAGTLGGSPGSGTSPKEGSTFSSPRNLMMARDRHPGFFTPPRSVRTSQEDVDIDGKREKSKKKQFGVTSKLSASYGSAKLKAQFRSLSRLWGSQRSKSGTKATKKPQMNLAHLFGNEAGETNGGNSRTLETATLDMTREDSLGDLHTIPCSPLREDRRMKGRSRSVGDLDSLSTGMYDDYPVPPVSARGGRGPLATGTRNKMDFNWNKQL